GGVDRHGPRRSGQGRASARQRQEAEVRRRRVLRENEVSEYTAKDVQKLRQTAGVGMMDAKQALDDASGDFDKATELLRERGLAKMAKRADRDANEGTIGVYLHHQNDHPVLGVVVELACET